MTDESDPLAAMGRVASGIYILTVSSGGQSTGMLASWVMQAGFEPPMLSVAVKKGRYVEDWLTDGHAFVVNIVAEKQFDLLKHFGSGFDLGVPAFEGVPTEPSSAGVPIISDCLGHLECEPVSHVDSGDHRVFLGKVLRGDLHADAQPMTHIRKTGSHY
ncbi:MAG: flavin reductase family protein [Planctomycetota bacterium]